MGRPKHVEKGPKPGMSRNPAAAGGPEGQGGPQRGPENNIAMPMGLTGAIQPLLRQCVGPAGRLYICRDARKGVLGACGSSAHVHGQLRSRQFRVESLGFRV